ncbi:hypothetical protein IGI04_019073 [Brassica rapa subsp. trilocularis]|uniref:Uncharacterized protein n=1 Tax=Brassica rapa subsp. trilocularis TaxID=1813537 RepID=A0ABQ7MES7_BRACM|nr:hypothetical protein IGI04_019073 [Brassica rapa subsp. trilocularis]
MDMALSYKVSLSMKTTPYQHCSQLDVSGHLRLIDGQHFPILQTFKLKEGPFINYQVHPMVSREPKQWCINQFNRGDQGGDFYWRYFGMTV